MSLNYFQVNFPDMGVQLTENMGEKNPFDVMVGPTVCFNPEFSSFYFTD